MKSEIDIRNEFENTFGREATLAVSAPGRVNLIGEHTDYNRGWVLPMAVERRIWAAGRCTSGNKIKLSSANMPEPVEIQGHITRTGAWIDYPLGVIWALRENGCRVPGVEIRFHGDLPIGGGLSSSAAIEVATASLLTNLCALPISNKEIARLCQLAENQFVGMNCGAMDQMASALAEEGKVLYIDCADFTYDLIPLNVGDYKVVVVDSGIKRELAGSEYNRRRKECEMAARELGVKSLRDLSVDDINKIEKLPDPIGRRARHVVTENDRVRRAVKYLSKSKLEEFGVLMNASHSSLRHDYEVSISELDFLVDACNEIDGVLGARLTGAGFGGCIVALAHSDSIPAIEKNVLEPYCKKFGERPSLMTSKPAKGVRIED